MFKTQCLTSMQIDTRIWYSGKTADHNKTHTGCCFNIKMRSSLHMNSYYQDKTVSWPYHLYNPNHHISRWSLYGNKPQVSIQYHNIDNLQKWKRRAPFRAYSWAVQNCAPSRPYDEPFKYNNIHNKFSMGRLQKEKYIFHGLIYFQLHPQFIQNKCLQKIKGLHICTDWYTNLPHQPKNGF